MGWIISLLVIGGITTALIYQGNQSTKNKKLVDEQVLKEYFQALQEKKYEVAWNYYSNTLKEKTSLPEFISHYQKLNEAWGDLEKYTIYRASVQYNIFDKSKKMYATIQYDFEKKMLTVDYYFNKKEDGTLEITGFGSKYDMYSEYCPW